MQKETIYFLEWIAEKSGFTENQILENMRPENQCWEEFYDLEYFTIEEFKKIIPEKYLLEAFYWDSSMLKPDELFWEDIHFEWDELVNSNKYNIEFSRYPIENWEMKTPPKKIKVKSKLKI